LFTVIVYSIKCLRNQIAQENNYYSFDPEAADDKDAEQQNMRDQFAKLCAVCGCKADFKCSKCEGVNYCSRQHQKAHWSVHKKCCGKQQAQLASADIEAESVSLGEVFPVYGLSVSEEELDKKDRSSTAATKVPENVHVWEGADAPEVGESGEDDDKNLTQKEYNKALGNEVPDPAYDKFMARVRRGGAGQVLRYSRWPTAEEIQKGQGALVISSLNDNTGAVGGSAAVCAHCGAPRKFEFQV
jgi:pre-rRNA-processing protein TSR4